jgi:glyoxylase-like metal-dependent hydrolase (beta-lactamase superfamily II)
VSGFQEVAAGVFVWRYPVLDVNVTLVVGGDAALVVDTLSGAGQAGELASAVRRVTPLPLVLVNTHHHFDHCFGNATLAAGGAGAIWGHEWATAELRVHGEHWRRRWYEEFSVSEPALAEELAAARIVPPDRLVRDSAVVPLGGRDVGLHHFGRGHTAGDLVAVVPDAAVVVAGDLVEEGAPPDFSDGYPLDWPDTLAALLPSLTPTTTVVPGHGAIVDRDFVRAQHGQLSDLDWLIREGHAADALPETLARKAPFPYEGALIAVRRGYAQL